MVVYMINGIPVSIQTFITSFSSLSLSFLEVIQQTYIHFNEALNFIEKLYPVIYAL